MRTLFHGSPFLFDKFDLSNAGEGTGTKFGFGVYLTEVEASAVHYSQPRKMELMPDHYLYTVEIPDLAEDNHLVSSMPVSPIIIDKVEGKLGIAVPEKVRTQGKEFRKWVGMMLMDTPKASFVEEKAAAELLNGLVLVIEYLNDLLSLDHFLDIAVHGAEGLLRVHKIATGFLHDDADHFEHKEAEHDDDERQPDALEQHGDKDRDDGENRVDDLRKALGKHFTERVRVVGVVAHDVAVGV